jgi:hypothetical protein
MNLYNWQIFAGTLVILSLMIITTLAARLPGREDLILFVLVLGITWPFMMGRYDFLIHRIGVYLGQSGSAWEISQVRNYRRFFLSFYDAGSALPIIVLFGNAVYQSWRLGYQKTANGSVVLFLVGVGLLIYAPMVHNGLRQR